MSWLDRLPQPPSGRNRHAHLHPPAPARRGVACLASAAIAVSGLTAGSSLAQPAVRTDPGADPAYYSMRLPAGTTVADLVRAGFDIGHGHGSRPVVVATPAEVERLRALGISLGR